MGLGHNYPWIDAHITLTVMGSNLILQWLQKYVIAKAGETCGSRTTLFSQILIDFSYFSSNFTYFLPHFGSPGGQVAHPERPLLCHCPTSLFIVTIACSNSKIELNSRLAKITFSPNATIILDQNAVSHPMTPYNLPREWRNFQYIWFYLYFFRMCFCHWVTQRVWVTTTWHTRYGTQYRWDDWAMNLYWDAVFGCSYTQEDTLTVR